MFLRFLIFKKAINKKNVLAFLRFASIRFLVFEKGISKKIPLGFLRFVGMLFLIFEKKGEPKKCARFCKIFKYTFFNI